MKTRMNSILEKKLEELESLLEAITFNDDDPPNVNEKLVNGLLFAKKLLEAEMSSRRNDVEGEEDVEVMFKLRYIETRLTEIGDFITNQVAGYDNDSFVEPEIGSLEPDAGIVNSDTGSVTSLVESCMNESSNVEEKEVMDEKWPLFQDGASEEKREIKFPAMATVVVDRRMEEKRRVGFRVVVCFGLIGLVCGMVSLFGYIGDNVKKDHIFLTPT